MSKNDTNKLSSKQRRTWLAIFDSPIRSDVRWSDVEALFKALGADISEGRGSRVRVHLNGVRAVFHRSHPRPDTDKGALRAVQRFLKAAGVHSHA